MFLSCGIFWLIHWGRVAHICVSKLTIVGLDNGLLPGRHQAITNCSDILIEIQNVSFSNAHLKCRLQNGVHFVMVHGYYANLSRTHWRGSPSVGKHMLCIVWSTGVTPAKNTDDAAGALRNALTACNILEGTKRFSGAVWISARNGQRTSWTPNNRTFCIHAVLRNIASNISNVSVTPIWPCVNSKLEVYCEKSLHGHWTCKTDFRYVIVNNGPSDITKCVEPTGGEHRTDYQALTHAHQLQLRTALE